MQGFAYKKKDKIGYERALYFVESLLYAKKQKEKQETSFMTIDFRKELIEITEETRVQAQEPMSRHTTFRLGGNADYLVDAKNADEVKALIDLCKRENVPFYVIGNGSNILVGDKGYRGVIIRIFKHMNEVWVKECVVYAQAGALLSKIANAALAESLTGFEFAAGIPGTLGGAVVMNAGAYGGELKDVLQWAEVVTDDGEILRLSAEELELGYRTSIIAKKGYVVLGGAIQLQKSDKDKIKAQMDDLKERRITKQPLEYPSAGSTFKRPVGYFAGKLIYDAGLRGFKLGGAQVSQKHCGFVINTGNATAKDVVDLIEEVQKRVKGNAGVTLETEVRRLGDF